MTCLDDYDAVLCDLDGCLISGNLVLPGARRFADHLGERLWVLSNNSRDTAESLSRRLAGLGLEVDPARMLLAGALAVEHLAADAEVTEVAIFGTDALRAHARQLGLRLGDEHPSHVLLTRAPDFDYDQLNRLIRHVGAGAALVVANGDATHPGEDGTAGLPVRIKSPPVPVRAQDARKAALELAWAVEGTGDEEARGAFEGDILDDIAGMLALVEEACIEGRARG